MQNPEQAIEVAHILKQISHPKRFLLLCRLIDGPKTVWELEQYCTISQSQMSQFLGKMRDEGILGSEKKWQFVEYRIADERIIKMIEAVKQIFCGE